MQGYNNRRNPKRIDVKEGGVFGEAQVDALKMRPASVWDTFSIAAAQTATVSIFAVPVGSADPVSSNTKTEEDTNIRTQNRLDNDFRVLAALFVPDPNATLADIKSLHERGRLRLVVNQTTTLIDEPLSTLFASPIQASYAVGDTNAAAGTAITYTMQAVPGFTPWVYRFPQDQRIVIPEGKPIRCELTFKNTGSNLLAAERLCRFQLRGLAAIPVGA